MRVSLPGITLIVFLCLPELALAADPFKVLGLTNRATPAEVTKAFRTRMLREHPDSGGPASDARLRELIEAYHAAKATSDSAPSQVKPETEAYSEALEEQYVQDLAEFRAATTEYYERHRDQFAFADWAKTSAPGDIARSVRVGGELAAYFRFRYDVNGRAWHPKFLFEMCTGHRASAVPMAFGSAHFLVMISDLKSTSAHLPTKSLNKELLFYLNGRDYASGLSAFIRKVMRRDGRVTTAERELIGLLLRVLPIVCSAREAGCVRDLIDDLRPDRAVKRYLGPEWPILSSLVDRAIALEPAAAARLRDVQRRAPFTTVLERCTAILTSR